MRFLAASVVGFSLVLAPVMASAERRALAYPVYYQDLGYAVGGFDPVSFFVEDEPSPGAMSYSVMWKGVTWLFASAEHQKMFEANPRAYAPRFGGYCAYGVSMGRLLSGDPQSYEIRDGALYMMHSPAVQAQWSLDPEGRLLNARQNWPEILRD